MFVRGRQLSYTEEQAREAIAVSLSWAESLRRLGLCPTGGAWKVLKKYAALWEIPTDHFERNGRPPVHGRPLESLLVEHSPVRGTKLKEKLYRAGLKTRECELCGQGEEWNGLRIALILDHINGVRDDNRIENLRIVCPNCNAGLDTHCGRKKKIIREPRSCALCGEQFTPRYEQQKYCSQECGVHHPSRPGPRPSTQRVKRPPPDELNALVERHGYEAVGRMFGVSGNAIRKWFKSYGATPPAGLHRDAVGSKRLTELQARRALQMLAEGLTVRSVATIMDVSEHRIRDLKQGRTYRHVQRPSQDVA